MATLICAKCNKEIEEENSVECPHCWEIYHRECWDELSNCVTCKKFNPFYEMAQARKEAESKEQKEEIQKIREENEENTAEFDDKRPMLPQTAYSLFFASVAILIAGVLGGLAFAVYMYYTGKLLVGIIGGLAFIALGFAISVLFKGIDEFVGNSHKSLFYLSKLAENEEKKENDR